MNKAAQATGGRILVEALAAHGVRRLACVAGESYLAVLDALVDFPDIDVVTCRHESGAGFMAEGWGKLSGGPGVAFVTRGPGACNASIAVHTAMQDCTPMVLFMGQVRRDEKGREAFQEVDTAALFAPIAKWAVDINDPADIPAVVAKAFYLAVSGRPGPVVLGLPEDMLTEAVPVEAVCAPRMAVHAAPAEEDMTCLQGFLEKAERPVVIVGGPGWEDQTCRDFQEFAARCHLPVAAAFRRQDLFNAGHACYIGDLGYGPNPALVARVREADLVLVCGERITDVMTQGFTAFGPAPEADRTLVHVFPDKGVFGKVYMPDLAIEAAPGSFVAALPALSVDGGRWEDWRESARADYLAWSDPGPQIQEGWRGADMTSVFAQLRDLLPADAIVTCDAGNFFGWSARYLRYGRPGRLLGPANGAMGYAVPTAVGAALAEPGRLCLGLCGDGGFMMTASEMATAMHHGAKPVILVCNNSMYGTIRMHQERDYPGRVSATGLTNPDFVAYARSFGAFAARVEDAADFADVWRRAMEADVLRVIEIRMDPRQITTATVL